MVIEEQNFGGVGMVYVYGLCFLLMASEEMRVKGLCVEAGKTARDTMTSVDKIAEIIFS